MGRLAHLVDFSSRGHSRSFGGSLVTWGPLPRDRFIYDVLDRRIGKLVDTTSPFDMVDAVIERYVHDDASGVASLAGGNVVLDFVDPDGDGQAPMELTARYLYGAAVDQILAKEDLAEALQDPERVLWHLADHLETTRDLADHEGALVEHYEYDSFGNVVSGDTSLTRYLFTAREWDADVDLQYSRARWYDPSVGRWISEDPVGFAAGDVNLARYVGNLPTGATDPSGLRTEQIYIDFGGSVTGTAINVYLTGGAGPARTPAVARIIARAYTTTDIAVARVQWGHRVLTGQATVMDALPLARYLGPHGRNRAALGMVEPPRAPQIERVRSQITPATGRLPPVAPMGPMTPDQRALKELVDEATHGGRKPLTVDLADTVLDWADEVGYPGVRAIPGDVRNPSNWPGGGGQPHIHVPGVGIGLIPVQPGVKPR